MDEPPRSSGNRRTREKVSRIKVVGAVAGVVFVGGAALGNAVGPIAVGRGGGGGGGSGPASAESTHDLHGSGSPDAADAAASSSGDPDRTDHSSHTGGGEAAGPGEGHGTAMAEPSPALVAAGGYRLDADTTMFDGALGAQLSFRVRDTEGAVVQGYQVRHERELHLFVVAHDLRAFHHLHPERGIDGTWAVALPQLPPGMYRAFADFVVADGTPVTLATDLLVPGSGQYVGLPAVEPALLIDGGYVVERDGAPLAGQTGEVAFRVLQGGAPVTHLEPYLGAAGHLVAIRAADMAFLHVHPVEVAGAPPPAHEVRFAVTTPTPGDYRFFFDFAHAGTVHTAAFTVRVEFDNTVAGGDDPGSAGAPEAAG